VAKLQDIMRRDVITIPRDASVTDAAKAMTKARIGSAVIIEGGWLAGILTERDVLRAAAAGGDLRTSSVGDWMTADPLTAAPDADSEEAAQTMVSHGFRHLPVAEGNNVIGIVSLRDILAARVAARPQL
jgi:CBS domain-containing protein